MMKDHTGKRRLAVLSLSAALAMPGVGLPAYAAEGVPAASAEKAESPQSIQEAARKLEKEARTLGIPLYLFENGLPKEFGVKGGGSVGVSDSRRKDGQNSLKWEYEKGSELIVKEKIGFVPFTPNDRDQSIHSFAVWVYNEEPADDEITFQFGRGNNTDSLFKMNLNFSGWRAAWVSFERDMEGEPQPNMNRMIIKAPQSGSGTLYFDSMMLSTPIDPRHHTPDRQVPFVNGDVMEAANAHWLGLHHYSNLQAPEPKSEMADAALEGIRQIEAKFQDLLFKKQKVTAESMADIRSRYAKFGIVRGEDGVTGSSLYMPHFDQVPAPLKDSFKEMSNLGDLRAFTDLMELVANTYLSTEDSGLKDELAQMYINLADHFEDQGWADGSAQGTVHHLGYNVRGFYASAFLMRDVLEEEGLLDRTQKTLFWLSGAGKMYTPLEEVKANIDILNTTLNGMLASILIQKDSEEKLRDMESFSTWLSEGMRPAPGLDPAFKKDGSVFHHANHYPAYGNDAFKGVAPITYVLSGTPYRVEEDAHETMKKALLSMRLYSNKTEWLISIAGRHPTGKQGLALPPFRYLALAGTPDGKESIDREVASAYMRLMDKEDAAVKQFKELGITAELDPNGFWPMNYGSVGLQRREGWLAGVKGYSRYLWGNETYENANLYGRYISYGNLQIMNAYNHEDSGYHHDGWDWNRWPGTTVIHLPFEKLKSDVRNVDRFSGFEEMLLSDETYSGSLGLQGENGMFAMKLHEHPKYDGTHRARKSYFFFDNRIIALGSDIENENSEFPTETTLFQNHMKTEDEAIWTADSSAVTQFPFDAHSKIEKSTWLVDNKKNGYYVAPGQTIGVKRSTQASKSQKDGSDTAGDFSTAWIDHGKAPKDGAYEYAILVNTDAEKMAAFAKSMNDKEIAPYSVLKRDRSAHIVHDRATGITGYALFEADEHVDQGVVAAVDTPSMVMTRQDGEKLILSAVDPDLRLYEGIEEDQYDENGIQKEVSIYSREWRHAESKMKPMKLTIKGEWKLASQDKRIRILSAQGGKTVIEFDSKDAEPMEITLMPN